MNEILEYYKKLDWYDADLFDSDLGDLLVHYGFVKLGTSEDANPPGDKVEEK